MKNAIRLIILTLLTILSMSIIANAEDKLTVNIDGIPINYNDGAMPYISEKGNPMVPLSKTLQEFGATVTYDSNTREITVEKLNNSLIVPVDKQYIKVNGQNLILEEVTTIINGETMVEIMPVIHALRCAVNFQAQENILSIENRATYELLNFVDVVPDWAENPTPKIPVTTKQDLTGKKLIALTYDDGPNGESTSIILDVLKQNNAKATFFMLGQNVYNFKDQTIRTVNEGHEVANHSYSHKKLTSLGVNQLKQEIQNTQTAISSVTGVTPTLLRVPYGAFNQTVKANAGLPIIQWNIDTLDWKTRSASKTVESVLSTAKDGDIILMHNIHMSTAEATKTLVPELIKRGYTLVTVSELAQAKGVELQNGKVYNSFRK